LEPGVGIVHKKECHVLRDIGVGVAEGFEGVAGRAGASEFLRAEHGDDEVHEGGEGDQANEEVFHGEGGARCGPAQRTFRQK